MESDLHGYWLCTEFSTSNAQSLMYKDNYGYYFHDSTLELWANDGSSWKARASYTYKVEDGRLVLTSGNSTTYHDISSLTSKNLKVHDVYFNQVITLKKQSKAFSK